jgi:hypothetical protein
MAPNDMTARSSNEFEPHSVEKSVLSLSTAVHVEHGTESFETDQRLERRVLWKLDALLIPLISLLFIFLFLDRANIGNARVAGLQKSIHATDTQYQLGTPTPWRRPCI